MLKDDQAGIQNLGSIVQTVASGASHFSKKAHQLLLRNHPGADGDSALSPRQLETLSLCQAYPNESTAQLAARLSIANSTLRNLLSGAYIKLDVHTRNAAITKASQLGLITSRPQYH